MSLSELTAAPDEPAAIRIRPTFGSHPKKAVLTRGELAICRAHRSASEGDLAPTTLTVTSLVAPSPSRTSSVASAEHTLARAWLNAPRSRRVIAPLPASPLAINTTESLV